MRRRLVALVSWSLAAAATVAFLLLFAPLLAIALPKAAAQVVAAIVVTLLVAMVPALGLLGVWLPRRRTAADGDVARWVGARVPGLASDLLSAVELEREVAAPRFSRDLAVAFAESTAARLRDVRAHNLVDTRPARRAGRACVAGAAAYALVAIAAPGPLGQGWTRLLHPVRAAEPPTEAISVPEPLVGDLAVTLRFPAHTGRAPVTVPASSGDVTAPKGTEVILETTALRPAKLAFLVFDAGEGGAPERRLPLALEGERLRASFILDKPGSYRFMLQPDRGRPLVEADGRKLDVEVDRAPRVDLFAPADDLEVSSRKRVELAWNVDDDYGLREVALVWKSPTGRDERKILPFRPGRAAQGKLMWDLTEVDLQPGQRVAYHLEAKDNDEVSGPNVGSSRTYYLRVYSPRERHAELIERQQQLFERALALLGDRLELDASGNATAGLRGGPGEPTPLRDLNRGAQQLVVELGQIMPLVEKDPLSPKKLRTDLEAMRGRLEKLAREEADLLDDIAARQARAPDAGLSKAAQLQLADSGRKNVLELEKDVLLLDDWLGRQRLEEMLAITDEIKDRRAKLDKLMADYARTGSDKLRQEIERELRALEQLERELAEKRARLGGEVADRFLNADALEMDESEDCLGKVRELMAAGKVKAAKAKLDECNEMMGKAAQALEDGLRELRGEKFSEEQKAFDELMDEVADLEQEQREVAREAGEIEERWRQEAAKVAKEKSNPFKEKARKTVERLREELGAVPREGLTPFGQDEHDALMRRLDDVERMIEEGDVAEALAMAKEARTGLETLLEDLDDDMSDGQPWSDKTDEALLRAHKAEPLAEQLVEELEQATPRPEDVMSAADRKRLAELQRRQAGLRGRADRLAQKAQKKAKELPQNSADNAQRGLGEAAQKMEGAEKRMKATDPSGARAEAEAAAEELGGLRKSMQQSSRPTMMGRGGSREDDEVHIPGAEEYKPPEAFREQILDAKRKGKAPEDYKEQVEQYYKEITQ